jgi:hypothetical protein
MGIELADWEVSLKVTREKLGPKVVKVVLATNENSDGAWLTVALDAEGCGTSLASGESDVFLFQRFTARIEWSGLWVESEVRASVKVMARRPEEARALAKKLAPS